MWKVGSGQKCQAGTNGIADSRLLKGDFSPSWLSIRPAFGRGADLRLAEHDAFSHLHPFKGGILASATPEDRAVFAHAHAVTDRHERSQRQSADSCFRSKSHIPTVGFCTDRHNAL